MGNSRGKITAILVLTQVLFIVLFGVFVDYEPALAGPGNYTERGMHSREAHEETIDTFYPMFQDIHVMMLVGFGFLMTFLKRYGFGSVAFNFLLTVYVIQWSVLVNGWFGLIGTNSTIIHINIVKMMEADFAVATVLISFGAVLGKASPVQLITMATLEVVIYNISLYIGYQLFEAIDVGGAIFIHAFGAYFGLSVAFMLYKKMHAHNDNEDSSYNSDMLAMIGTIFLWLYWPSFNAGPATHNERHRAVMNTILSLSSSTIWTFALSFILSKDNKIKMVHVQNATLAGGVILGASADLLLQPFGAMLCGSVAGIVSTLGYEYLQPILAKAHIHDTCGVHNLHGMPGILGAFVSAIACGVATKSGYNDSYSSLFPEGRTPGQQAGYQVAAIAASLGLAIVGGLLTGLLLRLPFWDNLTDEDELYNDEVYWDALEPETNSPPFYEEKKNVHELPGNQQNTGV